jgi:hypothetical protein
VHGLIVKEGGAYSFRPLTPDLEEKTRKLAACFRERRTAVITFIFSRPAEAVQSFADAFKIKKGGPHG